MLLTIPATLLALLVVTNGAVLDARHHKGATVASTGTSATSANGNRPHATGACCVPNSSLKEDVCTTAAGAVGKCVPANTAGCGAALTCIADVDLTCNAAVLENGKPTCRLTV